MATPTTPERLCTILPMPMPGFPTKRALVSVSQAAENSMWMILEVDGASVFQDGDQWCALIGPNLQEGVAGFGEEKGDALRDLITRLT